MKSLFLLLITLPIHGNVAQTTDDNLRYQYSILRMKFLTASEAEAAYSATTCVTDLQSGRPVFNAPFQIKYLNRDDSSDVQILTINSDENGCLAWLGHVQKIRSQSACFRRKQIRVEPTNRNFGTSLTVFLNPNNESFDFGFDAREITNDFPGSTFMPLCH